MQSRIHTTTALVACLSLGLQTPAFAQGNGVGNALGLAKQSARDLGLEMCTEGDAPCVTDENLVLLSVPDATFDTCGDPIVVPCALEDGLALIAPEDNQITALLVDVADAPVESEPADPEEIAGAETAPEVIEAEPVVESPSVEEQVVDGDAEQPGNEDMTETADGQDNASATLEGETTAEVVSAPEDPDTTSGEQIEEQTTAEVISAPDDDVDLSEQIEEQTSAEVIVAPDEGEQETAVTAESSATDASPEDMAAAETPSTAAAAAVSDESAQNTAENAEVTIEEVTEETTRSATEDFETSVAGTAETSSDDDGGLSNFERALLVGLGAVAVGSILDNGSEVVSSSGDRVVIRGNDGDLRVLKDDTALLRQPGSQVRTERFDDGSSRTIVTRDDGSRIVTILAPDGSVIRRARVFSDGSEVVLFDDTQEIEAVDVSRLPEPRARSGAVDITDETALRRALAQEMATDVDRAFSLRQVRNIREVRELAPEIDLDAITFRSGSAAIDPTQAAELAALGREMSRIIAARPWETFLIEGHTDAVGDAGYNLALSDRRAETVALALTQFFDVPPENLVVQGYGERFLKVDTQTDERLNRRATVRRITPLLQTASR